MAATIISGTRIAEQIRAEVSDGVAEMRAKHGVVPGLAVVLVGDDPASAVYVRNKERAAREAGMVSESVHLSGSASKQDVLDAVRRLNDDDRIHGILVQLPLPDHVDENTVLESIDPAKDVDGLHPFNMGLLMAGRPRFIPATPSGIQQMLFRSGFDPAGQNVVVLGRSSIVGKARRKPAYAEGRWRQRDGIRLPHPNSRPRLPSPGRPTSSSPPLVERGSSPPTW